MKKMMILCCALLCACAAPQVSAGAEPAASETGASVEVSGSETVFDPEEYLLSLPDDPRSREDIMTVSFDGIRHEELWDSFSAACAAGSDASVTICMYTVEGDPIYTYLAFCEGAYTAVTDNSRDGFGTPEMVTVQKRYMFERKNEIEEESAAGTMRTYLYRAVYLTDQEDPRTDTDSEGFPVQDEEWYYLWGITVPLSER